MYGVFRGALHHGHFESLYPRPHSKEKRISGNIFTITLNEQAHELLGIPKFSSLPKLSDLVTHKLPKRTTFMDPPGLILLTGTQSFLSIGY